MSETARRDSETRIIDGKEYTVIQLAPDEEVVEEFRRENQTAGLSGAVIMGDVCTGYETGGAKWVRKAPVLPTSGGRKPANRGNVL